jgi:hypothetical protein
VSDSLFLGIARNTGVRFFDFRVSEVSIMRKHQQNQILDVLKTITQAQTAGLYGDCQEGALSLCDFIESIEDDGGAGTEVVTLLVEYCELLFKASNGEIKEKNSKATFSKYRK